MTQLGGTDNSKDDRLAGLCENLLSEPTSDICLPNGVGRECSHTHVSCDDPEPESFLPNRGPRVL
jgi:hypothetical protein